ncbi:MAG: tetratricopeptide repeat protein [Ardenticatenales bacterium]|nr:tetratricopeptide repeat protein [Ardenticatenales bacterium]
MNNSDAHPHLDTKSSTFPDDAQAWLERGRQFAAQGQRQQAWQCFERALTLNPYLAEAHQALSTLMPPRPNLS